MANETLTDRFRRFCRDLPDSEWIDDLDLAGQLEGVRRADAFFAARTIVTEVKTIQTDQEPRLNELLAPFMADRRWPVFAGQWELEHIAEHIPIPEAVLDSSVRILGRAAEGWLRDANDQIRDTKVSFGLGQAVGMLVLLNDEVPVWRADTIAVQIGYWLVQRRADGRPRFEQIAGVWIVDEAHYRVEGTRRLYPCVKIPNPLVPGHEDVMTFLSQIEAPWAAATGIANAGELQRVNLSELEDADDERPGSPLPIHKAWTAEYRGRPYLRPLAELRVLSMMALLLVELGNRVQIPSQLPPRYQRHVKHVASRLGVSLGCAGTSLSRLPSLDLLHSWFHGLEELSTRGINLRAIVAYLPDTLTGSEPNPASPESDPTDG